MRLFSTTFFRASQITRTRPMIQKPFSSMTMPSTMPMLMAPLVILAKARRGILYWNRMFRSGLPFLMLRRSRAPSTAAASQPMGLRPCPISPRVMFRSMRTLFSGRGRPSRASYSASGTLATSPVL